MFLKTNKISNESRYYYVHHKKTERTREKLLLRNNSIDLVILIKINSLGLFFSNKLIMQNAAASNTTADNLAVLIDMGFSEEQSKEVKNKYID
jgi:hypothetical protein